MLLFYKIKFVGWYTSKVKDIKSRHVTVNLTFLILNTITPVNNNCSYRYYK